MMVELLEEVGSMSYPPGFLCFFLGFFFLVYLSMFVLVSFLYYLLLVYSSLEFIFLILHVFLSILSSYSFLTPFSNFLIFLIGLSPIFYCWPCFIYWLLFFEYIYIYISFSLCILLFYFTYFQFIIFTLVYFISINYLYLLNDFVWIRVLTPFYNLWLPSLFVVWLWFFYSC